MNKIYVCGSPLGHFNIKREPIKIDQNDYISNNENESDNDISIDSNDFNENSNGLLTQLRELKAENAILKQKQFENDNQIEKAVEKQIENRINSKNKQIDELKKLINDLCQKLSNYKIENDQLKKQTNEAHKELGNKCNELEKSIKDVKRTEILLKYYIYI